MEPTQHKGVSLVHLAIVMLLDSVSWGFNCPSLSAVYKYWWSLKVRAGAWKQGTHRRVSPSPFGLGLCAYSRDPSSHPPAASLPQWVQILGHVLSTEMIKHHLNATSKPGLCWRSLNTSISCSQPAIWTPAELLSLELLQPPKQPVSQLSGVMTNWGYYSAFKTSLCFSGSFFRNVCEISPWIWLQRSDLGKGVQRIYDVLSNTAQTCQAIGFLCHMSGEL